MNPVKSKKSAPRRARDLTSSDVRPAKWNRLASMTVAGTLAVLWGGRADALDPAVLPQNYTIRGGVKGITTTPLGTAGQRMTVEQNLRSALIDWQKFNIGSANEVYFKQPDAGSRILNRVIGTEASIIEGKLRADGQVFLLNRNGILINRGAQVNVASLVASTLALKMSDADFLDVSKPVFADVTTYNGVAPFTKFESEGNAGPILIGVNGSSSAPAQLTAVQQGSIILIASNIENRGVISAPDGQVILAAGNKAYLWQRNTDNSDARGSAIRGLMVEITADDGPVNVTNVVNNLGSITSDRGNVSIAALAINQKGRISAGTSVVQNGSVWLTARSVTEPGGGSFATEDDLDGSAGGAATRYGTITFAAGSRTETPLLADGATLAHSDSYTKFQASVVKPDGTSNTVSRDYRAWIHVVGNTIENQAATSTAAGGVISAPGGAIDLIVRGAGSRVLLGAGSLVSAAGNWVDQSMASNIIHVQRLTSNDLADSPLQRSGALLGAAVDFDARKGSTLFATQAYIDNRQETVQQKATVGGNVNITAREGDVVALAGSTIDVSGGGTRYAGGNLVTTKLIGSDGKLVDIATASPLSTYLGTAGEISKTYFKAGPMGWNVTKTYATSLSNKPVYEAAYVDGASGGSLNIVAPRIVQAGEWLGGVTLGRYQVAASDASTLPKGATLVIGDKSADPKSSNFDYLVNAIRLDRASELPADFALDTQLTGEAAAGTVILASDQAKLVSSQDETYQYRGFGTLDLYANDAITVPAGVTVSMAAGGALTATTRNVSENSRIELAAASNGKAGAAIVIPAGTVALNAPKVVIGGSADGQAGARIDVGGTVVADARPKDGIGAAGGTTAAAGDSLSQYVANNFSNLLGAMSQAAGKSLLGVAAPRFAINAASSNSIRINAASTEVEAGSSLSAMGGFRLAADNSLTFGNGGEISFVTMSPPSDIVYTPGPMRIAGKLLGYSLASGAKLSVNAASVRIAETPGTANLVDSDGQGDLLVRPGFFQTGGFGSYALTSASDLTVAAGTRIEAQAQGMAVKLTALQAGAGGVASGIPENLAAAGPSGADATLTGGGLLARLHLRDKPAGERAATTLSLATKQGSLTLAAGTVLAVDPKGTVNLTAKGDNANLEVLGKISAAGGAINLELSRGTTRLLDGAPGFDAANPDGDTQSGRIHLGAEAELSARGEFVESGDSSFGLTRESDGSLRMRQRVQGSILDGGSIKLTASEGRIVADAGSRMDVSAAAASVDQPTDATRSLYTATPLWGDAGSITLNSSEASRLDGSLSGKRAGQGAGGSFTFNFLRRNYVENDPAADPSTWVRPEFAHAIVVSAAAPGTEVVSGRDNTPMVTARLSADALNQGGFDALTLKTDHSLILAGDQTLSAARSLTLDAPIVDVRSAATPAEVHLQSARAILMNSTGNAPVNGNADASKPVQNVVTHGGEGILKVFANLIDLVGSVTVNGTATGTDAATGQAKTSIVLDSTGDIRASGNLVYQGGGTSSPALVGGLYSAGNIELQARQVYPTTLSDFTIASRNVDADSGAVTRSGSVSIGRNPGAADSVLSAGGKLKVYAEDIVQGGTLKAPLGNIALDGDRVSLLAGSLTSVSLDGQTIPFGETQLGGKNWIYSLAAYNSGVLPSTGVLTETTPPEKRIELTGKSLTVADNATIDLSGGGDLQAFEFVAGPGGSKDVLQTSATAPTWAILPSQRLSAAPLDTHLAARNGSNAYASGYNTIYISGVSGLADGYYPLLDAHYALLPGAYQVSAWSGSSYSNLPAGTRSYLADGTAVLSTYLGVAGTTIRGARTSGYVIRPGSVARQYAEFQLTGSSFFSDLAASNDKPAPRLPKDAGYLAMAPTQALVLNGNILAKPASGGLGAQVDISSDNVRIVAGVSDNPGDGVVELSAKSLSAIDGSLLVGGRRNADGSLETLAQTVEVANDAAHPLTVSDVILAARDTVVVDQGAVIDASKTSGSAAIEHLTTNGSGALLFASSGGLLDLQRSSGASAAGNVNVKSGAVIKGKSILLDATHNTLFNGQLSLQSGGAFSIAAGSVALGDTRNFSTTGLVLDNTRLAALGSLADLRIRSYSTLDMVGDTVIGNSNDQGGPLLGNLVLDAGQVIAHRADAAVAGKSAIKAQTVVLRNTTGQVTGDSVAAAASLDISGENVVLGSGDKVLRGFSAVNVAASNEVVGQGSGKTYVEGDLTVTTPRLVAATGANQTLAAARYAVSDNSATVSPDFALAVKAAPAKAGAASQVGAGGRWALAGKNVTIATTVAAPAGKIEVGAQDGVTLSSGGQLLAAGTAKAFTDKTVFASGGSVVLSADSGDIALEDGSLIDVSGARNSDGSAGSDAGRIKLTAAKGSVSLAGNVQGSAVSGQKSGSAEIDAGSLTKLAAINGKLNAGGFGYERIIRQRTGDMDILPAFASDGSTPAAAIKAQHVNLSADQGSIGMQGWIDASAASGGGRVELFAGKNAIVTGKIDAQGTGTTATASNGGQVEISAGGDRLEFASGATIDVSSGTVGNAGRVTFAVKREADGTLLSGTEGNKKNRLLLQGQIKATHTGKAPEIIVRGDRAYSADAGVVNPADTNIASDFTSFMATSAALRNSLKLNQSGGLQVSGLSADELAGALSVRTGIEIDSKAGSTASNLLLADAWDLTQSRWTSLDGEILAPGLLTLRASGDLKIANSLGLASDNLPNFKTWSFRLVGGADQSAANPLAVTAAGNVEIVDSNGTTSPVGKVRTGTGDIEIAAGGNLVIGNSSSHGNRAIVYSAGVLDTSGAVAAPSISDSKLQRYTVGGGDIRIAVGGDAIGSLDPTGQTANEFINDWLRRTTLPRTNATVDGTVVNSLSYLKANPASWWVYRPAFRHNVGSFGGGNIAVSAGGDIINLGVVAPSSGRSNIESGIGTSQVVRSLGTNGNAILEVRGGGNLDVAAGGNIKGSEFLLALGKGSIKAGGDVGKDNATALFVMGQGSSDGSSGGADLRVEAGGSANIQNVSNPTILALAQACTTVGSNGCVSDSTVQIEGGGTLRTGFFTYAPTSSVAITAVGGDLDLGTYASAKKSAYSTKLTGTTRTTVTTLDTGDESSDWSSVLPPVFSAVAMNGSISWQNKWAAADQRLTLDTQPINLFTSDRGSLTLLAGGSIADIAIQALNVSLSSIPTWNHPGAAGGTGTIGNSVNFAIGDSVLGARSSTFSTDSVRTIPATAADSTRSFIVEADGDLSESKFVFSQAASVRAGRDMKNVGLSLQNVSASDESIVSAGRDIIFDPSSFPGYGTPSTDTELVKLTAKAPSIKVAGSGTLTVEAGRLLDLGSSEGILADGQTRNSALGADSSARIVVLAGVTGSVKPATVGALLAAVKFFGVVSDAGSAAIFKELSAVLDTAVATDAASLDKLASALQGLAASGASKDIRNAAQNAADALRFARDADTPPRLLSALLGGMRKMAGVSSGYTDAASGVVKELTATALAGNTFGKGTVELFRSKIQTTGGSGIDVVAPGFDASGTAASTINVGRPGGGSGGNLGILTQTGGAIQTLVSGDLNVNQSKILTAQGGDIMLYSSDGSIDAGRGALTSRTSSPPRKVPLYKTIAKTDANGNSVYDANGNPVQVSVLVGYVYLPPSDVSGSGIRTVTSDPDGPGPLTAPAPGSVYLFAPKGTINAGEAGIASAGNVTLRAVQVLNATAISAAGSSSGVPVADTGALGSLATVGNLGGNVGKVSDDAMKATGAGRNDNPAESLRPMLLSVEVLSFGE